MAHAPTRDLVAAEVVPLGAEDREVGVEALAHGFGVQLVEGAVQVGLHDQVLELIELAASESQVD